MAKIIRLDKHVADLIAAGEVVERPASVVKELVENSMDAGATAVTVEIRHGGLEMIRVSDNGSGIDPDDIRTAFLRHATSKIRTAEDITAVNTMGFRGEALASIAAVSKVTVFTRAHRQTAGLCYEIEGGEERSLEEAGCPAGTTVIVRELFYNTPARMKFIKKDMTEAGHVQTVVRNAALARPDISFKLIKDGEELVHTPGNHSLSSAVYCVFGGTFASGMEEAGASHEGIRVHGYVSKPIYSHGNRKKQQFFVNRRPVRSRVLIAALEEAYKNRIMAGRYPACVLHVEVNPSLLDVNVHPAKAEIKFAFERAVFDAVYLAVRDAVDRADARAQIAGAVSAPRPPAFAGQDRPETEGFVQTVIRPDITGRGHSAAGAHPVAGDLPAEGDHPANVDRTPQVREGAVPGNAYRPGSEDPGAAEASGIYGSRQPLPEGIPAPHEGYAAPEGGIPQWKILGEAFDSYIIVEDGEDILFIDKHAAHERILFEKLSAQAGDPVSQYLLEPRVLRFERGELEMLFDNLELLRGMGFEYEAFGGDSILLRSVPEDIDAEDAQASLEEICECLSENRRTETTKKREELLRLVACKAALKAGSRSSHAEKYELVRRVMSFGDVKYCPHGRPVAAVLKRSDLEKRFGRT